MMRNIFKGLKQDGAKLTNGLRPKLRAEAKAMSGGVKDAMRSAINLPRFNPDLRVVETEMVNEATAAMNSAISSMLKKSRDALDRWANLAPDEEGAGNVGALNDKLSKLLERADTSAQAGVDRATSGAFADMNQIAQRSAGIEHYIWTAILDDKVRPAHAALDGQVCDWDDPPLSAEDASSGVASHPGEDDNFYPCRCVATPIVEEQPDEDTEAMTRTTPILAQASTMLWSVPMTAEDPMKIIITGGPRTGKTTLAKRYHDQYGVPVLRTDDLILRTSWSECSQVASEWMEEPGPWIVEGVAAVRGLRKWMERNKGGGLIVAYLDDPVVPQTEGQRAMHRATRSIWDSIRAEVKARGIPIAINEADLDVLVQKAHQWRAN
jgi:SPP1 gp7 family putative phage head morphogenesis protein